MYIYINIIYSSIRAFLYIHKVYVCIFGVYHLHYPRRSVSLENEILIGDLKYIFTGYYWKMCLCFDDIETFSVKFSHFYTEFKNINSFPIGISSYINNLHLIHAEK